MMVSMFVAFPRALTILHPRQSQSNFFFLLLNQKCLHRIVLIVLLDKLRQFSLFLQHWPLFCTIVLTCPPPLSPLLSILNLFRSFFKVNTLIRLVILLFVSGMIYLQCPAHNHCPSQIVYCKIRASLVLILEKCKAFRLAGLLVAD
jgi:hypothetical protein